MKYSVMVAATLWSGRVGALSFQFGLASEALGHRPAAVTFGHLYPRALHIRARTGMR